MACPGEGILTDLARRLVDKTIKEVNYFRHFEIHDREFEQDKQLLIRKLEKVLKDIEDAKRNNEYQIEGEVQDWIKEADNLIQNKTEMRQTRFENCWCPLRQYRHGKSLAHKTLTIKGHILKCNFERVACRDELSSMKYHAVGDFIEFESRKKKFKQLVEALVDGKHYMIGLQGMGGTGKTTLATQVGKQVEKSKAFEKVIFIVVSNPPDINKIRGDIARPLGLDLEEKIEAEHSQHLWTRISRNERKLLVILDDVWEGLDLKNIGIPFGPDNKNCYILITTRKLEVCKAMGCQQTVCLQVLADEEALTLFLSKARSSDNSSSNNLEGFAMDFVKECGGLPIAIVSLASTLRNWNVEELQAALITLRKSKPFVDLDENLEKVCRCLELSYVNLPNEKAQKLFLLCSIFPEDYEFPLNLIIRLGIGSGIFEEVDEYCEARRQALVLKTKLVDSSLLLNVDENKCVRMHDVVREVAQWIGREHIQVIMKPRTTLKANMRFVFWSADDFPDQFDGTKLEVLLLWINGDVVVKDPNEFFASIAGLKILFLHGEFVRKVPTPSLLKSLLPLKYIQTLILDGWKLGDISILKNIQSLVTLEFKSCLITELPRNIMDLQKLRWLGLRNCEIQKNNPFEVIERCSQLEELYFVGNHNINDWKPEDDKEIEDKVSHDISPSLELFSIAYDGFKRFANDDDGLSKCFNPELIKDLISEAMFKYLVGRAEVLELGKIGPTRWKNLVPEIIPVEDGGMDNLTKLYLYEWVDIEYLIDNSNYRHFHIPIFSKLVELHLYDVNVKKLYWGDMPFEFLKKLQILKLQKCMDLQNIFLDKNLNLPNLRVLELIDCPMFQPSLFQLSVAQSLVLLEELVIEGCKELKSLIAFESLEGHQENYDLLFPELNHLKIRRCEELKCVFGEYGDVGQVLKGKKCMPRPPLVLKESSTEKYENSKTSAFSRILGCCFKSPTKDTNIRVSNATLEGRTISQESCASSKGVIETFHHTAECLLRHPLSFKNVRQITLGGCSKAKSLFSVSIATTMIMLEKLYIRDCEELKNIITDEAEDDHHLNCTCIFPELQQLTIWNCNGLEFIFPSTPSGGLQKLKSIHINGAQELKCVFGKYDKEECVSNENENNGPPIHIPALESLDFYDVPNMISIGIKEYQLESLQHCVSNEEIKKQKQDVTNEGGKECEIQEIVHVESPLTPAVAFQYFLDFHNLKVITIWQNKKLKTLFSISAYRNLPRLSKLFIDECEELVSVVEDDSNDLHHMNSSSVFPKLEELSIQCCNKMEFIFPSSLCGTLQKLKSLFILGAAELNYIFWNESDESPIHLPALETMSFKGIPKIINKILARKYHLSFSHLQSIELGDLEEFNGRSFLDLMAYLQGMQLNMKAPKEMMKIMKDVQKLTSLRLRDSKIEKVIDLEGVEIEGPVMILSLEWMSLKSLSELRHIWKGSKYILSLPNLRTLDISKCRKLRAIFCVSIVKSLPQLNSLKIEDCDELVEIVEESDADHLHHLCFPKLEEIYIGRCNSLKCTFSISTPAMFPKLRWLTIEEAPKLEKVFIRKQDDTENMVVKDVFPMLSQLYLRELPMLVAICEGVDFQTVQCCLRIKDCPKYEATEEQLSVNSNNAQVVTHVAETSGSSKLAEVASKKETHEQGSQEDDAAEKATIAIQSTDSESRKKTRSSAETEKEGVRIHAAQLSMAPTLTSSEISQSIKGTLEQGPQENYSENDAITVVLSANSYSRKKSARPIDNLSRRDSAPIAKGKTRGIDEQVSDTNIPSEATPFKIALTIKETIYQSNVQEEVESVLAESMKEAMKTSIEEIAASSINQNIKVVTEDATRPFANSKNDSTQELKDEHPTCEATSLVQLPFADDSIDVIVKERVQESHTSKDAMLETVFADLAPRNLSSASITTLREQFPLDLMESRRGTIMTQQEAPAKKAYVSIGNIQKDNTTMKAKTDTSSSYSQAEDSLSRMSCESAQEETNTMEAKIDTSSFYSHVEGSQSGPSVMVTSMEKAAKQAFQKHDSSNEEALPTQSTNQELINQPGGSLDMPLGLEFAQTTNKSRDTNVRDKPKAEKTELDNLLRLSNIPMETNTGLHNVIPSSHHHHSQPGTGSSSSSVLEVGEILELVELKDGEEDLLAKALELYPQLRLSRGQRTRSVIAFSYRVHIDILVMLTTKTPHTITASDKLALEESLGTATFLGFEKGWIESVRNRVFGIDMFDVTMVEEEIEMLKAELETSDITLEQLRKQRVEIKEQIAGVISQFEAIDSQLWGFLEDREKLMKKMMELRGILSAQDRPFGI